MLEKASLLEETGPAAAGKAADGSMVRKAVMSLAAAACICWLVAMCWPMQATTDPTPEPQDSLSHILKRAGKRALGGGISGAVAGVAQVLALMWLRTTMNYQYRYGTSTSEALRTLWAQGGIPRLYQGLPYALLQTPLSRFGDTAANTGVLALLAGTSATAGLPVGVRTAVASVAAAMWRMLITPLDTLKTTLQVEGAVAYQLLLSKASQHGACVLWAGAVANAVANFVGGYPWFLTFNALDELLPKPAGTELTIKLVRSAFLGICATAVSDCLSNSIRVVKTTRQTASQNLSYFAASRLVIEQDGLRGLFLRGLGTRLIANLLQAAIFSVIWKQLEGELARLGIGR